MAWIDTNGLYHGTWDYTQAGCAIRDWNSTQGGPGRPRCRRPAACAATATASRSLYFENDWINLKDPQIEPHPARAAGRRTRPGSGWRLCRDRKVDPRGRALHLLWNGYAHAVQPLEAFRQAADRCRPTPSGNAGGQLRLDRRPALPGDAGDHPRGPRAGAGHAARRHARRRGRRRAPAGSSSRRRCRTSRRRWPRRAERRASSSWPGSDRRGRSAWRPSCTASDRAELHAGESTLLGADAAVRSTPIRRRPTGPAALRAGARLGRRPQQAGRTCRRSRAAAAPAARRRPSLKAAAASCSIRLPWQPPPGERGSATTSTAARPGQPELQKITPAPVRRRAYTDGPAGAGRAVRLRGPRGEPPRRRERPTAAGLGRGRDRSRSRCSRSRSTRTCAGQRLGGEPLPGKLHGQAAHRRRSARPRDTAAT